MRHYAGVKAILCLALLFAAHASADEAADRGAIDRTIAALNAPCKLERVWRVKPRTFRPAIRCASGRSSHCHHFVRALGRSGV
jgi:hypothetical protein